MINIRKRGNTYQYCFEAGKVNGKRKQITKCRFKTNNDIFDSVLIPLKEEQQNIHYLSIQFPFQLRRYHQKEYRSLMNVPFFTESPEQEAKVIVATKAAGFDNLKGHRSVGGMRASIYNAMPKEGVEALVEFLRKFEAEYQK